MERKESIKVALEEWAKLLDCNGACKQRNRQYVGMCEECEFLSWR